jgi:hypothetical protein
MNQKDPQIPKSPHWMTEGFWIGFRVVAPVKEPTEEQKRKFWDADDPFTIDVIKRDREIRDLVSADVVTSPAPSGAASTAGASSGK